jgi:sortase A
VPLIPTTSRYGDPVFGRILGAVGKLLIIAGVLVLGFVAFQLWGTQFEESRGQSKLTEDLASDLGSTDSATLDLSQLNEELAKVDTQTAPPTEAPAEGDPVGIINIAKIDLQRVIVEGVDKADLKKGPGHYPGTPLPGQAGNSAIAGHRTTYGAPFNRIDELVPGDEIAVTTPQGEFTYVVIPAPGATDQAWWVVDPSQVEVLADAGDNRLTLTACHPKYSAKQRIIVAATLKTEPAQAVPVAATPDSAASDAARVETQFDEGLEGDPDALPRSLLFLGGAAAVALLAWFLARHVRRWPIYLLATPAILVLIWFGYVYMDRYLPTL